MKTISIGRVRGDCGWDKRTHVFIPILNKCISSWFALQQPSLMKQKIELGHFAELGKHLQKSVSDLGTFFKLVPNVLGINNSKRVYRLVDTGMKASYV